jgi:ABC-type multidrug transport system ATPase subunit
MSEYTCPKTNLPLPISLSPLPPKNIYSIPVTFAKIKQTTLMSLLTDWIPYNVKAIANVDLPGVSAFCPQDDQLHGFYTCKSYLQHYARLSGLASNSDATNREIDRLLSQLGLTGQADTIVGDLFFKGLSGGQKRRLSIALEALTHPQNLFLDEPTSGLDAESALQVMEFLKQYARGSPGRRVIVTIHQPSSFLWQLIDHAILLSKGQVMYNGSRDTMESFFASAGYPTQVGWNPADHYVTVVNDEFRDHALSVPEWANKFQEWQRIQQEQQQQNVATPAASGTVSSYPRAASIVKASQDIAMIATKRHGSSIQTVGELTYRYFLNLWFNPGILATRAIMLAMLSLMIGGLFYDLGSKNDFDSVVSRVAVLFYCVAFFIFMSVAVLPFTLMERAIVDKEVLNKYYHPIAYQTSQGIASIPGAALLAFIATAIVVPLVGLREPVWFGLNMFLALTIAEALAQLVSHVVPHFVIGMAIVAGMYGFFMLCEGFMMTPSRFPDWLRWTNSIAFHTYSWRTFMYKEFHDQDYSNSVPPFESGNAILVQYEIEDIVPENDMVVLVGYALVMHLLSFVVLHLKYYVIRGKVEPIGTTGK